MSNACGCQNSGNTDFAELAPVLEKYAKVPGSLITILQQAQEIYGYLSEEAINYIAETDRASCRPRSTELLLFTRSVPSDSPSANTCIMLCKGTACHVNGADRIEEAVCEHLGITGRRDHRGRSCSL